MVKLNEDSAGKDNSIIIIGEMGRGDFDIVSFFTTLTNTAFVFFYFYLKLIWLQTLNYLFFIFE